MKEFGPILINKHDEPHFSGSFITDLLSIEKLKPNEVVVLISVIKEIISHEKDRITFEELQEITNINKVSLIRIVDKLVYRGLLNREIPKEIPRTSKYNYGQYLLRLFKEVY